MLSGSLRRLLLLGLALASFDPVSAQEKLAWKLDRKSTRLNSSHRT